MNSQVWDVTLYRPVHSCWYCERAQCLRHYDKAAQLLDTEISIYI